MNATDPSGDMTLGICGEASGQLGAILGGGVSGSACLTRTVFDGGTDQIGTTETAGGTFLTAGASVGVGVSYQISNATNLNELTGWFNNITVDISLGPGFGLGVSASIFWGQSASKASIYGITIGVSVGYSASYYPTNTWVQVAHDWWIADPLRGLWDALLPPGINTAASLTDLLHEVRFIVANEKAGGSGC